jgi:hypothetical protein
MQETHLHQFEHFKSAIIQKGQNQWIELPSAFHFKSPKVFIKPIGNAIVLIR